MVALPACAAAQTVPLVGAPRDVAREVLVDPVVFDPLLLAPLASTPQAVVDVHGSDVNVSAHAAARNGDDSYGIIVSTPLASTSDPTGAGPGVDARGLRQHPTFGIELTNVIWRPVATPALARHLPNEAVSVLDPAARASLARAMQEEPIVSVPWVLFFHASYQFNRSQYDVADAATGEQKSATHLNDTASLLLGLQTRVRPADPGYFFGASFIYSAVFRDATPASGEPAMSPVKVRGNTVKVEMRRPLVRAHAGINPSYAYDTSSQVKTIDLAAYLQVPRAAGPLGARAYGGVRAGYQTGTAGGFVSVFGGVVFKTADRSASVSRD
jgi:hypothetical protein